MQTGPPEADHSSSPSEPSSDPHQALHHGVSVPRASASRSPHREDRGRPGPPASVASSSSWALDGAWVDGDDDSRRLISAESPERRRSPVHRIAEYERAATPSPSKTGEGPAFRVIGRRDDALADDVSPIAEFPNGTVPLRVESDIAADPTRRGPHAHPVPSPANDSVSRGAGVPPLPRARDHASRLEARLCALLPRSRCSALTVCIVDRAQRSLGGWRRRDASLRASRLQQAHGPGFVEKRVYSAHAPAPLSRAWKAGADVAQVRHVIFETGLAPGWQCSRYLQLAAACYRQPRTRDIRRWLGEEIPTLHPRMRRAGVGLPQRPCHRQD